MKYSHWWQNSDFYSSAGPHSFFLTIFAQAASCARGVQLDYCACLAAKSLCRGWIQCRALVLEDKEPGPGFVFRVGRCKPSCLGSAGSLRAIPLVTASSFSSHSFYWSHYCVGGLQNTLYFSFLVSGNISSFSDASLEMLYDCLLCFLICALFARILMQRRRESKNTWKCVSINCSHCSVCSYHLCLASLLQYHFFCHWGSCNLYLLIIFLYPNMLKDEGDWKPEKAAKGGRWMRMSALYVQRLKWKQVEISSLGCYLPLFVFLTQCWGTWWHTLKSENM